MNTQTITASVRKQAKKFNGMVSLPIEYGNLYIDAKAFARAPFAMEALLAAEPGNEIELEGHWETNPKNGYQTFIVAAVKKKQDSVTHIRKRDTLDKNNYAYWQQALAAKGYTFDDYDKYDIERPYSAMSADERKFWLDMF